MKMKSNAIKCRLFCKDKHPQGLLVHLLVEIATTQMPTTRPRARGAASGSLISGVNASSENETKLTFNTL